MARFTRKSAHRADDHHFLSEDLSHDLQEISHLVGRNADDYLVWLDFDMPSDPSDLLSSLSELFWNARVKPHGLQIITAIATRSSRPSWVPRMLMAGSSTWRCARASRFVVCRDRPVKTPCVHRSNRDEGPAHESGPFLDPCADRVYLPMYLAVKPNEVAPLLQGKTDLPECVREVQDDELDILLR